MKKVFKMELKDGYTPLCKEIVAAAAESNGGKKFSLETLKKIADTCINTLPDINQKTTIELIGNNLLHIDVKIGENYETVCVIEEVEVWDMEETVPDENVVLQRHLN